MIEVVVHARRLEAQGVVSLDLRPISGTLPPFTAGSHIDVEIPTIDKPLLRQYSLSNDPQDTHRYVIGVGRDPASRGGSAWLCEEAKEGDVLRISPPRNRFPLFEDATNSILIAGGIGITPMLAMARRLSALGRRWVLYLCARTPDRAAFLKEAQGLPGGLVVPVFDGMPGVKSLDLASVVKAASPDAHLYCCGPEPLMRAFEKACAGRNPATVHVEWFKAPESLAATSSIDHAFTVHLHRSGRSIEVPVGKTILDALVAANVNVPHSCCDGICGTCETRVLAGEPDHRDTVLFGDDNQSIIVCVSRCKGESLTLDL